MMKGSPRAKATAPLTPTEAGRAFHTEWIDFDRGIRVGNLEPEERITQILKSYLQARHAQPFICDRWGRGAFWQWICWVPRRNREAKPVSSNVNWSSAKFYISIDKDDREFTVGMMVERGPAIGPERFKGCLLQPDWDWHRLWAQLRKGSALDAEMKRLLHDDGFRAWIGGSNAAKTLDAHTYKSAGQLKRALASAADRDWAGFQLYYPMPQAEVQACAGRNSSRPPARSSTNSRPRSTR